MVGGRAAMLPGLGTADKPAKWQKALKDRVRYPGKRVPSLSTNNGCVARVDARCRERGFDTQLDSGLTASLGLAATSTMTISQGCAKRCCQCVGCAGARSLTRRLSRKASNRSLEGSEVTFKLACMSLLARLERKRCPPSVAGCLRSHEHVDSCCCCEAAGGRGRVSSHCCYRPNSSSALNPAGSLTIDSRMIPVLGVRSATSVEAKSEAVRQMPFAPRKRGRGKKGKKRVAGGKRGNAPVLRQSNLKEERCGLDLSRSSFLRISRSST
ncbi:hypothetical protein L1887_50296 [Cichorium endivia]|nr:hypothetical protein L1887_50296 [Cichorium endivia]